jgi:hypothetical protein
MSLTVKAAILARAAPHEWRAFLAELAVHTAEVKDNLVKAPIEEIQRAQGRAQQCASLLTLLSGAVNNADRITDRIERRSK